MGIQIYCSLMLSFLKNKFGGSKQKGLKQNNQYVTIWHSRCGVQHLRINYVGLWFLAQQDVIYIEDVSVIGIRNCENQWPASRQ